MLDICFNLNSEEQTKGLFTNTCIIVNGKFRDMIGVLISNQSK